MQNDQPEPSIIINGRTLSDAQACVVRVAIESFAGTLLEGLGDDEHGRRMAVAYEARINEIRGLMFQQPEKAGLRQSVAASSLRESSHPTA